MAGTDVKIRLALEGAAVVSSGLDSVHAGMGKLGGAAASLQNILGGLGAALTVGALVAHVKGIIDAGDAMNDLSQRVGIAVKDLAKYQLATAQSGTSMESLARGIKGISTNLVEHGPALEKAGLSATTADGALRQLADLFQKMPDGMEKTALAVKLFGKAGMDLIPMLNMGSKGLDEAAEKSAKYAAVMAAMAPQADQFNDNMAELGMLSKIAGMNMVNSMLPVLIEITRAMADAAQKGGTLAGVWAGLAVAHEKLFGLDAIQQRNEILHLTRDLETLNKTNSVRDFFGADQSAQIITQINQKTAELAAAKKAYFNLNSSAGAGRGSVNPALVKPDKAGIADWMEEYKKMMAALQGGTGTTKAAQSEFDKLAQKLSGEVAKGAADAEAAQNGYNKAQTDFVALTHTDVWDKLSASQKAVVAALFEARINSELLADATKALAKAELDAATAHDKYVVSLIDGLDKMQQDTAAMQENIDRLGLNRDALAALDAAKLEAKATTLELMAIKKLDKDLDETQYNLLKAQAKELHEQAALKLKTAAKEDQIAATKAELDSQVSMWRSIDSTAHDVFVNIFEGGQNAFTKLRDVLKATLLDLLYQMTVKKWIFQIFASVTGGGSSLAQAAGMGGNSMISSLGGSALNSVSGGFTNGLYSEAANGTLLANIGAGYAGVGGSFASSVGAGLATDAMGATVVEGAAAATLGSGSAIGTVLAAIPVVGWIALAVVAAYAMFSGGETRSGASYALGPDGKAIKTEGPSGGEIAGAQSRGAIEATAVGIQTLMKDLGSSAKLSGFVAGLESSENGKGFAFAGGQIGGQDFGVTARSKVSNFRDLNPEEAIKQYGVELQRATLQAVQVASGVLGRTSSAQVGTGTFRPDMAGGEGSSGAQIEIMRTEVTQLMTEAELAAAEVASGIPGIIRAMLRGVDLEGMGNEAVAALMASINQIVANVKAISKIGEDTAMKNLAGLSFDAAAGLATLAGGFDKLLPLLDAAYPILYSEGERAAASASALAAQFTSLGVTMPDNVAALRSMIESQDLNTVAGQAMAAALYSLVPAFGQAAAAADSARQQMASALQNFGTPAEQRNFTVDTIQQSLASAGLNLTHDQIASASREDARNLYLQQIALGTVEGNRAAEAIIKNQAAFAGITSQSNFLNPSSSGGGGGGGGAGSSGASAADPWKSAADAIVAAIKDLQTTLISTGPNSFARLQAQFAVETAQAKAGSLSAAQDLPALAKLLVDAGAQYGTSTNTEQALLIARTIESMSGVVQSRGMSVPSFDVGTNYVPRDMLAMVHRGEAITPRAYNPAAGGGNNNAELVAEVRALRLEVAALRASSEATAAATRTTAKVLDAAQHGQPIYQKAVV